MWRDRNTGNNTCHWYIDLPPTPPLEFPIPAYVRKAPHKSNMLTPTRGYEATSYQAVLQAKMAELQDLVEVHIAESANRTMTGIQLRGSSSLRTWCGCHCPQQANLIRDGRETGQYLRSMKSSVTVEITDGERTKVVHTNRLYRRTLPNQELPLIQQNPAGSSTQPWELPGVDHSLHRLRGDTRRERTRQTWILSSGRETVVLTSSHLRC